MAKLVHFEITGADSAALADFYSRHLGFETHPSPFIPGYHLLETKEGVSGAAMDSTYQKQPAILWFEVDDIDAKVREIQAAGGAAAGDRNTIPGRGHLQYVKDPQGNIFGLRQPL